MSTPSPVTLHIYDISTTNACTDNMGIGLYHSGVEVYGHEYGYGGHPFPFSGLMQKVPKDTDELGDNFHFKQSVPIGFTNQTETEVDRLLVVLANEYHGDKYHLVSKNCNHFSDKFCRLLCSKGPPGWVNRLADITCRIPMLDRVLPANWLKPFAGGMTIEELVGTEVDSSRVWEITFCNKLPWGSQSQL